MSTTLDIRNGPGKADLLRSVTNVAKGLTTTFETDRGPIEAQIESIDESTNGVDFLPHHPSSAAFHSGESITSKRRRGG